MQRFGNGAPLLPPNRYGSSSSGSSSVARNRSLVSAPTPDYHNDANSSSGSGSSGANASSSSGVGQMRQFQLQHERQPLLLQVHTIQHYIADCDSKRLCLYVYVMSTQLYTVVCVQRCLANFMQTCVYRYML
jgi:hypothetical protein